MDLVHLVNDVNPAADGLYPAKVAAVLLADPRTSKTTHLADAAAPADDVTGDPAGDPDTSTTDSDGGDAGDNPKE
jgi:hypothetical protein